MSDMQVDRKNTRDGKLKVRVGDVGRQQERSNFNDRNG